MRAAACAETRCRPGAALVMALLLIVVLDCIVLGTLHLSLQEHRIASNHAAALSLRLEAESAVRRASARWSVVFDTMPAGAHHRLALPAPATPRTRLHIERVHTHLFLIDALTAEPLPRVGRAAARLLVTPPAVPPGLDPSLAPLSATGTVHVGPTGTLSAAAPASCPAGTALHAALVRRLSDLSIDPAARFDAPGGVLGADDVSPHFDRIAALAAALSIRLVSSGDTVLSGTVSGVVISHGDLTLAAGAVFDGLLIARGRVTVAAGAAVRGAVHGGSAIVDGSITWDPCTVAAARTAARLDRPAPTGPRSWLPSF